VLQLKKESIFAIPLPFHGSPPHPFHIQGTIDGVLGPAEIPNGNAAQGLVATTWIKLKVKIPGSSRSMNWQ